MPGSACSKHIFVLLEDSRFDQVWSAHFLTVTIPSKACSAHISRLLLPAMPKDGCFKQSWWRHLLPTTLIIPFEACSAHMSILLLPVIPNVARFEQFWGGHTASRAFLDTNSGKYEFTSC